MNRLSTVALGAAVAMLPDLAAARRGDADPLRPCPDVADAPGLVRCALDHSEAVLRARGEVAAAEGRRSTADRFFPANPSVELAAGHRRTDSGRVDTDRSIDLSQQIEIGGQRSARLAVVRAEEDATALAFEAARREVVIDVLDSVVAVSRARAGLQFAVEEQELAERLVAVSAGRAKQGLGTGLDVELAEAARVQARRGEVLATKALREAEGMLALVVGADVKLAEGAAPPAMFIPSVSLAQLERRALAQHPALQGPLAEAKVARARLDLLGRERVPDLTLAAGYKHEEFGDVLGGRLSVPLPLFRRSQGAIAEQEARIGQAEATAAKAELRVRLEVRAAYEAYQRAGTVLGEIPGDLEERLATDVVALRDAYGRGAMPLTSALASLREVFAARRMLADTRADALVTSLQLARASASPVPLDMTGGQP